MNYKRIKHLCILEINQNTDIHEKRSKCNLHQLRGCLLLLNIVTRRYTMMQQNLLHLRESSRFLHEQIALDYNETKATTPEIVK